MYVHMFTHLHIYVCDPSRGIGRGGSKRLDKPSFQTRIFFLKIANYLSGHSFKYNSPLEMNVVNNPHLHMHIILINLYSNQVPLKLFISCYTWCSVELYRQFLWGINLFVWDYIQASYVHSQHKSVKIIITKSIYFAFIKCDWIYENRPYRHKKWNPFYSWLLNLHSCTT